MHRTASVLLALLFTTYASEASMNDQTILGTATDGRITQCGVTVSADKMASLRPFIETSSAVSGSVMLTIIKQSVSGTSQTRQGWNFSNGSLGGSSVLVDLPATVSIEMDVTDDKGAGLCRLETQLVLNQGGSPA